MPASGTNCASSTATATQANSARNFSCTAGSWPFLGSWPILMMTRQAETGGRAGDSGAAIVWHSVIFGGRSAPDWAVGYSPHYRRSPRRWSANRPKPDHQKWPRAQNRREGCQPRAIRHVPYADGPLLARCFAVSLIRSLAPICPASHEGEFRKLIFHGGFS